ncbi:hypothetical protein [Nonomuraea aridisoli]|uniref:hypothetical protein n=1 Tax=Nonomuraea aridisoli TaxID=2070368 RepID=UPI0015E8C671|nr:hypothetical protein [Nonomuraea aridisoli]
MAGSVGRLSAKPLQSRSNPLQPSFNPHFRLVGRTLKPFSAIAPNPIKGAATSFLSLSFRGGLQWSYRSGWQLRGDRQWPGRREKERLHDEIPRASPARLPLPRRGATPNEGNGAGVAGQGTVDTGGWTQTPAVPPTRHRQLKHRQLEHHLKPMCWPTAAGFS